MKKILAIDGGGIRGIIPGRVMIALEHELQRRSGNTDARLADYFDFFAGTSTGGILTCLYLCPSAEDPSRPRFSAEQAVNLYVKYGGEIFDVPTWNKLVNFGGARDEKYEADALENRLKEYFGDILLSQLVKPCIVSSYDIENRNAHFFAQHDCAVHGDGRDFLVRDVCRATSAAPTYFEAARVPSRSGVSYALVDGGVFVNNPALSAYSEVRNSDGNPTAKDMLIVSLGTGSVNKPYPYEKAKDWGAVGWIKPIIDIMMSGASETTDYHLKKMFAAVRHSDQYIRLQPERFAHASQEMDDASQENIMALLEVGTITAENCREELKRIADILVREKENPDPVTFGLPARLAVTLTDENGASLGG
jgi:patatin-like phospholipase/acyl hydrolase